MAVEKSIKRSGFVIYSDLKFSTFTAVKNTRYVKEVPFVTKGVPFIPQMVFKGERGGASERILSV